MDRKYMILIGLGFELVALTIAMVYIGSIADKKYALGGMGVAGGAVFGLVGWLVHLIAVMQKLEKSEPPGAP